MLPPVVGIAQGANIAPGVNSARGEMLPRYWILPAKKTVDPRRNCCPQEYLLPSAEIVARRTNIASKENFGLKVNVALLVSSASKTNVARRAIVAPTTNVALLRVAFVGKRPEGHCCYWRQKIFPMTTLVLALKCVMRVGVRGKREIKECWVYIIWHILSGNRKKNWLNNFHFIFFFFTSYE